MTKQYKVHYTVMIGGKTVEHMTDTEGLKKLLDAAERAEVALHRIEVR